MGGHRKNLSIVNIVYHLVLYCEALYITQAPSIMGGQKLFPIMENIGLVTNYWAAACLVFKFKQITNTLIKKSNKLQTSKHKQVTGQHVGFFKYVKTNYKKQTNKYKQITGQAACWVFKATFYS